jgi:predicted transcriptional regulator
MQKVNYPKNPRTAVLVRSARHRLGLNQGDFAAKIGKSQGVVSRYERGSVDPPGAVVMQCMHILRGGDGAQYQAGASPLPELLTTLEAAVAIVKSMQEAAPDLCAGDTDDTHSHLPRQA